MGSLPVVYVCKKCKHSKGLQTALERETDARVRLVGCQDVCRQPLAGTRIGRSLEWFGGLDNKKRQRALIDVVNGLAGGRIPAVLAKSHSRKRAGKGPR